MLKNDTKRQVQEKQYVTEIGVYHTYESRRKIENCKNYSDRGG